MKNQELRESILIADDNPNNLKVLSAMLAPKGYEVRVALDGKQALASIRKSPVDLVLLDIHMPGMDGYEVCDAIQADPALKSIPVIFISALSEPFNKVMGFRKGAVDYIEKPFQLEEVEARVDTQLKLLALRRQLTCRAESSEERFRLTFENAAVGIAHIRKDGSFVRVNRGLCDILGYDRQTLTELTAWEVSQSDDLAKDMTELGRLFDNKVEVLRKEDKFQRKDGTSIWCRVTVSMARDLREESDYGIAVVEDITDRIQAEENRMKMEALLRRAQRMEAIGTLAGGIAHDFNNVLGVIMGYTELIELSLDHDARAAKGIAAIKSATIRAKDLVGHILTSCRKAEQEKEPVLVEAVVREALELLEASLPSVISIKTNISPCKAVLADPTQIHQVVMNLCTNAFHAMEQRGGTLGVSLAPFSVDEDQDMRQLALSPGQYVLLEICDTGTGMPPMVLERIFDPYFTTKPKGKGTGLGLSVVHGIVKSHQGEIFAYSEEERGTTFKVYLPCLAQVAEMAVPDTDRSLAGGDESILVADDDKDYLEMMADLLTNLGYDVVAVDGSLKALELVRAEPDRFDCLITDMTMPVMTGDRLASEVLAISPNIPVIMFTGFSEVITRESAENLGIRAFLMKPASPARVAATLRAVLEQDRSGSSAMSQ